MNLCLAHFQYEVWIDGECWMWVAAEVPEGERRYAYRYFLDRFFEGKLGPIRPPLTGCHFAIRKEAA